MKPLQVGVAGWSLGQPTLAAVFDAAADLGIGVVQVGPIETDPLKTDGYVASFLASRAARPDIEVSALMLAWRGEDYSSIDTIHRTGGYGDPATAADRVERSCRGVELAARLGVPVVSTHVGFVPPESAGEPFARMVGYLRRIGERADACGVRFALETGQETAGELLSLLTAVDRPAVAVNFDPANMILYGRGEPLAALRLLGPHVVHVHAKDALWSPEPGRTWGREVPLGEGAVDVAAYVAHLREIGYGGPLVIEREAGEDRPADIAAGKRLLESLI
jgi:sugar phosphate isomerase/epimerase